MKKLLFFVILGMSTIGFSQPYNYVPWGGSPGNPPVPYTVPDPLFDQISELNSNASGQRFSKFDRTSDASTPIEDDNNTFGTNNPTSTDTGGTDNDRGWNTKDPSILPSVGYYSAIRGHASGGPRGWGAWMFYTVNFTEAGLYNPMLRVRDGAANRNQTYEINIYSPTNMSEPLYTQNIDCTGATVAGTDSTDGSARLMQVINGGTTNNCVWFRVNTGFTVATPGRYIVKIDNKTSAGSGGLGGYTFWKAAAVIAPEVVLNSPLNGQVFEAGSPILLSAKATVGDGTLSKVEFFDDATSLGVGVAMGGGVYELTINATGKVYNVTAVVTETGGVAPDTATSLSASKVIGISDSFGGTNYIGTPWNGTPWSFTTDNTANYVKGNTISRTSAADMYNGIPVWAYDLGSVNRQLEKSTTSMRYVAGGSTVNNGSTGTDIRGAKAFDAGKTLSISDDFSRDATVPGASRFLNNSTDYRAALGGAWARYSCNFAPGQYKLIVRGSGDVCSANFNLYARILNPDGTPVGTTSTVTYNAGQPVAVCASESNVTKLDPVATPAYSVFTAPTTNTHWVKVETVLELSGNVIFELGDPDPVNGGNIPGNGALGEFTFEYVGPSLSTTKFQENNLKVYVNGTILNVNYDSIDEASVSVYDINGKQILSKPIVGGKMVAELPVSGIYIVNVKSRGATKATKVVVK